MSMTLGSWMKQVYTLVPLTQCRSLLLVLKSSFQSMFQTVYHKVMLAKYCRLIWSFFFPSSYILFWSSIIWFIYKHYQKLSRNKLCCLYMSSLTIKPCYSLCCLLSMQCQDYSNTKCHHLYIYNQSSHTLVYAASILYTRPSYTSYQYGLLSIQIYTNCLSSKQTRNKSYNIHQYQ